MLRLAFYSINFTYSNHVFFTWIFISYVHSEWVGKRCKLFFAAQTTFFKYVFLSAAAELTILECRVFSLLCPIDFLCL